MIPDQAHFNPKHWQSCVHVCVCVGGCAPARAPQACACTALPGAWFQIHSDRTQTASPFHSKSAENQGFLRRFSGTSQNVSAAPSAHIEEGPSCLTSTQTVFLFRMQCPDRTMDAVHCRRTRGSTPRPSAPVHRACLCHAQPPHQCPVPHGLHPQEGQTPHNNTTAYSKSTTVPCADGVTAHQFLLFPTPFLGGGAPPPPSAHASSWCAPLPPRF